MYLQDSTVLLFNGNVQVSVHGVHVCALQCTSYIISLHSDPTYHTIIGGSVC